MNPNWFFRMSRWARNPPSAKQVKIVLGILAICFVVVAIERFVGWPDALTAGRDAFRAPRP